ncbi:MAG TPA: histidine kinase [Polyangiaceae bacterium]|nr:histidine kinase [Polyangiaceae bacterium]
MKNTLKALIRPKSARETFVASLVFYNPLIAGAFNVVLGGTHDFGRRWLIGTAISEVAALQCFAGVYILRRLERTYHRLRGRPSRACSIGSSFLLAAAILPLSLPLGFAVGGYVAHALGRDWGSPSFGSYRVGIGVGFVIAAVFFLQRSRIEARDAAHAAEAKIRELENRELQARLSALTAEMNPHLLFNALNTIASLVHRDPDRAEGVVLQLADLYRGILKSSGSSTHSLADELRLCDAYLQVEHARFGDRLKYAIDVESTIRTDTVRVPVLILQPFVENAVQHGFSTRARGGTVRIDIAIRKNQLTMIVEDDGIGFGHSTTTGTGKGIANCRARLALAYGSGARVEVMKRDEGGTRALIALTIGGEA